MENTALELRRARTPRDPSPDRALPLQERQRRTLHARRHLQDERGERLGELGWTGATRAHGGTSEVTNNDAVGRFPLNATS